MGGLNLKHDPLLEALADLETLTIPQRGYVMSALIGTFVAAAMAQFRISQAEATDYILRVIRDRTAEVRVKIPVS